MNINKSIPFVMIKADLLKLQKENIRFVIIPMPQNVIDVIFNRLDIRGKSSILIPNDGIANERKIINEPTVNNIRSSSLSQIE